MNVKYILQFNVNVYFKQWCCDIKQFQVFPMTNPSERKVKEEEDREGKQYVNRGHFVLPATP